MKIGQLFCLLLFSYLVPWSYCLVSQFWADHGGASSKLNLFEFPLILILCLVFYFKPRKKRKAISIHEAAPALLIAGLYVLYDIAYYYYLRSPRLSDFKNYHLLFSISPFLFVSTLLILGIAIFPLCYSIIAWSKESKLITIIQILLIKLLVISSIILFITSNYAYKIQTNELNYVSFSDTLNVKKNGRITSFIYYHNKRNSFLKKVSTFEHLSINKLFYSKKINVPRNIHIIILESFIDPRLINGLTFNQSPVHKNFDKFLLRGSSFSHVYSPVYGGGTAQSEFEILTGIPALGLVDSIDFNIFEGSKTSSFVNILNSSGYHTIASVATSGSFYNAKASYAGIGFSEVNLLDNKSYIHKQNYDKNIFDGDLLNQNLNYIKNNISNNNHILNYIVGMYGHFPYDRNQDVRPDTIYTNSDSSTINNISNQFYYRTSAIAHYLNALHKIDPNAIVLLISDHIPPIFNKKTTYSLSYNSNIAILLDRFLPVDISEKKYYVIPHILWALLTESPTPSQPPFHPYSAQEVYQSFILEAMGLVGVAK